MADTDYIQEEARSFKPLAKANSDAHMPSAAELARAKGPPPGCLQWRITPLRDAIYFA